MSDDEGFLPVIEEKELQEGKMKLVRVEGTPVLFIKQKKFSEATDPLSKAIEYVVSCGQTVVKPGCVRVFFNRTVGQD